MRKSLRLAGLFLVATGMGLMACGGPTGPGPGPDPPPGFDDHTVDGFQSAEDLIAYGDLGILPIQIKFVFTGFDQEEPGDTHLLDASFYTLHDEWYWFRLLNGETIDGVDVEPETDLSFDSIDEVYLAYEGVSAGGLPLDLKWVDGGKRVYSPHFYELGLWDDPRLLGLGSILHYPAHPDRVIPDDLWLFELEYVDGSKNAPLDAALVRRFFERIEAALPPELRPELKWLLRSLDQKAVAQTLVAAGNPHGSRVVTMADLVVEGEVQVYSPGIAAGYVKRFEEGALNPATLHPNHVVLLEEVPDYLPPVAAILTAVPQTPLAHLNLLAASRGTPNAYVAGLMAIEGPEDWETWKTPILVRAGPDGVVIQPVAKGDYNTYLAMTGAGAYEIPVADLTDAPDFFDLRIGGLDSVATLVPLTGGKAAAMMALVDDPEIPTPHAPMAITVRPFAQHMEGLAGWVDTLTGDPDFLGDGRVRFLTLEGMDDYLQENGDGPETQDWVEGYLSEDASAVIRDVVQAGGLKRVIRDHPLDADFQQDFVEAIETQYTGLNPAQGLRFRSSSTAEDAPGFNGAGLYDSNSGYRDTSLQDPDLSKRTLSWALLKTWASYWGYEAYEERRLAGIDHQLGRMGVLVHPRFDDPLELANGVLTFELAREEDGDVMRMVANTQLGALSVTNPDPAHPADPAIVQVTATGSGPPVIDRVQTSSETGPGVLLLDDDDLLWLFERLQGLAQSWLDTQNASLTAAHGRSTLVLDLEFKRMASGWPALAGGEDASGGLVLKQVRTLDRAIRADESIVDMPIPRDVLEQAHRVLRRTCWGDGVELEIIEVLTDPAVTWALHHEVVPFDARFHLAMEDGLAALGIETGKSSTFTHLDASSAHPGLASGGGWDLELVIAPSSRTAIGVHELTIDDEGGWTMTNANGQASGAFTCTADELMLSAEAFLETLVDP